METTHSRLGISGIVLSVLLTIFLFSPILAFAGGDGGGGGGGTNGAGPSSSNSPDNGAESSNHGGPDSSGSYTGGNTGGSNCYYQSGGGDTGQVLVCSPTTHYVYINNQCTAVGSNVLGGQTYSSLASCVTAHGSNPPPGSTTGSNSGSNSGSNGSCSNGATNWPTCTTNGGGSCLDGAVNPPSCSACGSGYAMSSGYCRKVCVDQNVCTADKTKIVRSCSGATVSNCAASDAYCDTSSGAPACTPFPVTFVSFSAVSLSTGGSTPFDATGHLEASPKLVRAGNQSQLFWNVTHAESCAVTRSDIPGTISSAFSSGSSGLAVPDITGQTIFTLHCIAHAGATPPYINETATVNVVPAYNVQ